MLSGNCAEMKTSTPFRDLSHAANLRHGNDGFTSPPKEGVLRILVWSLVATFLFLFFCAHLFPLDATAFVVMDTEIDATSPLQILFADASCFHRFLLSVLYHQYCKDILL